MSNPSLFSEIIHTNLEVLPQSQSAFTCSKLTIETQEQAVKYVTLKTPERRHWHRSGAFSVNFEHISHLVLVFLLLLHMWYHGKILAKEFIKFHVRGINQTANDDMFI